jgi:hypothetical protein
MKGFQMKARSILMWASQFVIIIGFIAVECFGQKIDNPKKVEAPQAVSKAFHAAYPKAEIKNVSMETKDSTQYYEIESIDGKVRRDLLYTADGKVYEIEESLAPEGLPSNVRKALDKNFPGLVVSKAEKITHGEAVQFEILLENDENIKEVVIDSAGKVLFQKSVGEEEDNDEGAEPDED